MESTDIDNIDQAEQYLEHLIDIIEDKDRKILHLSQQFNLIQDDIAMNRRSSTKMHDLTILNKLIEENERLRLQLLNMTNESIDSLQSELEATKNENQSLKERLVALEEEKAFLSHKIKDLSLRNDDNLLIKVLKKKIHDLQNRIALHEIE
ncbi:hypothetical protein PCE1_004852 [Barthelona sp. PCE]